MISILTHSSLKKDIARRIENIQRKMAENDFGALIVVGDGAPGSIGALRYISNAHLWAGRAFGVLGQEDPNPWLEIRSDYQAVWTKNETTTKKNRVESPDEVVKRTTDLAKDYTGAGERIGVVNMNKLLSVGELTQFEQSLSDYDFVDATSEFNAIRQVKTPFELEAIQQNGSILDRSFDVFQEEAEVGVRYWDACAAVEEFVKSHGAFWGRTKLSLDITPFTVPTAKDKRIQAEDIINFEIVYESPWGYWQEMTSVFSFGELPEEKASLLDGYLRAVDASSTVAKPGNTLGQISESNDQTLKDLGFPVDGKHTPDCHSTGLDNNDGPNSADSPDFELKENMVLSFHPGTVLEEDRGFLISDNFLVTPEGGVRLSPHTADRYHLRID